MQKFTFLCADIGTSSLKTALVSENGQVLSFYREPFKNNQKSKTSSLWISALQISIYKIKRDLNIKDKLCCDAIAISGNGPTIVSEDGTTLLWNEDISNTEQFSDFKPVAQKYSASLFLPRINYFKYCYPQSFNNKKIYSGPEYLISYLTSNHVTILPESRYKDAYWNDESLEQIGADKNLFGKFVPPGFNCGSVQKEMSSFFSIKEGTPVIAGGPDFIAAMIGTNTLQEGKICDCAGSSEGINLCTSKPVSFEGLRTLPSVIPGLWNLAFLSQSSGKEFVSCKEEYEFDTNSIISYSAYIKKCFEDKYFPGFEIMKKLAENCKTGLELLIRCAKENNLPVSDTMMITGGQANNDKWIQFKSDILNYKIGMTETADCELIGDAVCAAFGINLYSSITEAADSIVKQKRTFIPQGFTE